MPAKTAKKVENHSKEGLINTTLGKPGSQLCNLEILRGLLRDLIRKVTRAVKKSLRNLFGP